MNIQTDHIIEYQRPDIVVVDRENNQHCSARWKGAREGGQTSRLGKENYKALEGWSHGDIHRHWHFRNDTKRYGGESVNTGNKDKSWIDSESDTPRNSMNTKEGTGAWVEDSGRERL